jgi:hypothetical protein
MVAKVRSIQNLRKIGNDINEIVWEWFVSVRARNF